MFARPSTRDLVLQNAQRLDDHVRGCTEETRRTQETLKALSDGLKASTIERRAQYDKMQAMMWKVAWGIISMMGAILFDVFKARGIL